MLRALAFCLCLALPVPAQALSCLPWHVEDAFQAADASEDTYVIVTGTLDFAAADLPQVDWARQSEVPPETRAPARLRGFVLGGAGDKVPFDEPLQMIIQCAGPWCPQLTPGAEYMAFVNTARQPYELRIGACDGMAFQSPDANMRARVQTCFDGGQCSPPER